MIIDNRDGKEIEFLAMPIEAIKEGDLPVPDIEYEETEGLDGVVRSYIAVKWYKVNEGDFVKKYDIADHVVVAGCLLEETSKGGDGKLACDEKSIYAVYHPVEEWINQHIIELPLTSPK
jgi:hypothetical protein